jgi:NADH dehydrogenase/NADH:ubiquinone oxidoreductase subunit G
LVMESAMTLTIDGRTVAFKGRPMILELARENGIFIPSLCDHPGLEPYAACRLCLVEVKGRKGYAPACSTAAEEGLDVVTVTPELEALRRGILELILAEHPHACLICAEKASCDDYKSTIRKTGEVTGCVLCPANGICELQRVVEAMGLAQVPFPSHRRAGEIRRDSPFIDRDNSLCILCGRCVRVCQEIRGACVLTFGSRGSETVVTTALGRSLQDSGCRFCGACVDVCPTGSLADRALRYERPAEAESRSICPLCAQGCRLLVRSREGRVLGAVPDPEGPANAGQACVKGRFLVRTALVHPRRLLKPLIREAGALREASWEEALDLAASRLQAFGPGEAAVTASAQSSCEDLFVLFRLAAEVLEASDWSGPWDASAAAGLRDLGRKAKLPLPLNFRLAEIAEARTIVIIGEDLPVTQPIVGLHVHRAASKGAEVIKVDAGKRALGLVSRLDPSKPAVILFGPALVGGADGPAHLAALETATGGRLIALDLEANLRGGLAIAEAFPARPAAAAARALYLAGPHPKLEPGRADLVIVQGSYGNDALAAADIVLPEAIAFETEGTFVNVEGRIQVSSPAASPAGEAWPGWKIATELARRLGSHGFAFDSAAAVRAALAAAVPAFAGAASPAAARGEAFLTERPAAARPSRPYRFAPRDPDDYKGLSLADEHKGLKLVRGR